MLLKLSSLLKCINPKCFGAINAAENTSIHIGLASYRRCWRALIHNGCGAINASETALINNAMGAIDAAEMR